MPRDLPGDVTGEDRKRRHPGPPDRSAPPAPSPSPSPAPRPEPTVPTHVDIVNMKTPERLTFLDDRNLFPTEVTWALGNSSLSNKEIAKAAKFFAKQFDLPVGDYFTKAQTSDVRGGQAPAHGVSLIRYEDPINGGLLSLKNARRLLERVEPLIIENWLSRTKGEGDRERRIGGRKGQGESRTPVQPKNIIAVLNHLTPLVGDELSFGEALAVARDVVTNRSGKKFAPNLELLLRGAMSNDPKLAIATAAEAASRGTQFTDFTDVVAWLAGSDRESVQAARAAQAGGLLDPENPVTNVGTEITAKTDTQTIRSSVGDLSVISDLYDAIRNKNTSYSEAAEEILSQVENPIDDRGIGDKLTGGIVKVLDVANRPLDAFMRIAGDPDATLGFFSTDPTGGFTGVDALQDAKDILVGDASIYNLQRMKELGWSSGEIIFWEMAISIGIPAGAGAKAFAEAASFGGKVRAGALFTGEFLLDPLTSGGKLVRVAGGRRFLPFLDPESQGKAVSKFLTDTQRALGGVDVPTFLDRAAQAGSDANAYFRKSVNLFRSSFGTDGLDPLTARSIFSWSRKAAAEGVDEATRVRGIRNFISEAMGIPTGDHLANEIADIVYANQRAALPKARGLTEQLANEEAKKVARRNGQALADQLDRGALELERTGPRIHEVPRLAGPVRRNLALGDSKLSRALRATAINELPLRKGNHFTFLPDQDIAVASDGLETVLVRSRVFSQEEIAAYRQKFLSAGRPNFAGRERAMGEVLDEVQTKMLKRIGSDLGVEPDDLEHFVQKVFARESAPPPQPFYNPLVRADKQVPMFPSQLRNKFDLLDPVRVRKAAKETMGYLREARAAAARTIGKDAPITKGAKTITPSHVIGVAARDVAKPFLGLVKAGWVFRPAYILRIVAGDETLRWLATEGFMNRVRAGKRLSALLSKSDVTAREAAEIAERTGLSVEDARKLALPGLLADEPQAGQGAIQFLNNARGDILPPEIQSAYIDHWTSVLKGEVSDDEFVSSWYRALFQYGQDEMGQEILRLRNAGVDEEDAIHSLGQWLRNDPIGQSVVKRMRQVPEWDADEVTRNAVEYGYLLTPDVKLADLAAQGDLSADALKFVDPDIWPTVVHGPALNGLAKQPNALSRMGRSAAHLIGELPTNTLIRQPYFKHHYSTMYTFLREQAIAAGKTIDDKLDNALQEESKRFAIKRTQAVMFDFTRSGRISEMAWFVAPFLQPFSEFFVAWPRIAKNNPALFGYLNRLGNAAAETNFIAEDPQTGEQIIPASNYLAAAPLLKLVTGTGNKDNLGGGWALSMNLSGLNMFTNSVLPVNVAGVDIPIPTPSFSPPAQWALQQLVDRAPINEELKIKYMSWLTEYGEVSGARPQDWALPTWLRHALTGAVPSWFQEETNKNKNRFLAVQQAEAQARGEDWTYDDEKDATAQWQAQHFALARAFFSAFFPAAPKIDFPTADLEEEWQATIDANDGDFGAAYDDFVGVWNPRTKKFEGGSHPGLTLIATGKTMWADEDNPFPMPANKMAEQILQSEGGKKFAKDFPRWAFFIIPAEIRSGDVDMGTLNAQVLRGERKVRTPSQFAESADVNAAWSAAFAVREQWTAWQNAHPEQSSGDPGYDARQGQYETDIKSIAEEFPAWDGATQITLDTGVDPNVMTEARRLLTSEEFTTKTDAGQGLKAYFEGRDQLEIDMRKANVSNLDTNVAKDLGFTKRYNDLVASVSEEHPDFALAYDRFGFDQDLRNVRTKGELALDKLPADVVEKVTKWGDHWETLTSSPYGGGKVSDEEKFAQYGKIRSFADTAYKFPPGENPLKLWWGTRDPSEKRDYLVGLSNRDALYWSRFDWEVMGGKPTKATSNFWEQVDNARSEAFSRNNTDPDFALGDALDRIDKAVAIAVKKSPKLKEQLAILNKWSYGLEKTVMDGIAGTGAVASPKTKADWKDVFDASKTVQDAADKYGLVGSGDYDPERAVYWKTIKTALAKYVKQKQKENPTFSRQWDYVQGLLGSDRILNILMPDDYYPLGVTGD